MRHVLICGARVLDTVRLSDLPLAAVSAADAGLRLSDLPKRARAVVLAVEARHAHDTIARRLADLGFVAGEPLQLLGHAPFGRDPLLVRIGNTRFALRRDEAARVRVRRMQTTP